MGKLWIKSCFTIIAVLAMVRQSSTVCVLESDFGFAVNCNFKKSGLFRIRNLGGAKLNFGLGFSLGDELGFPESLGNVEAVKKRSLDVRTSGESSLPESKLIQVASVENTSPWNPYDSSWTRQQQQPQQNNVMARTMMPSRYPIVASTPQGFKRRSQQLMTEAQSLPLGVPPFRKLSLPKFAARKGSVSSAAKVPEFKGLPSSITSQQLVQPTKIEYYPKESHPDVDLKGHTIEELAAIAGVSEEYIRTAIKIRQQQMLKEKLTPAASSSSSVTVRPPISKSPLTTSPRPITKQTTEKLLLVTPVAVKSPSIDEEKYINHKKETKLSNMPKKKATNTKKVVHYGQKVMNAPKEYYPVGYEKNFDDNFKSKIDLPVTSFNCGDQRHFPGLYADEDLGCMVFHVCALTDDGLTMKSFLCPESTLFDQSVLKCNWWFYTDCKNSKSLYDSNLPVSKSYQLMKSLSYFNNNYKAPHNTSSVSNGNSGAADEGNQLLKVAELLVDDDKHQPEAGASSDEVKSENKVSIVMAKDSSAEKKN